MKNKTKIRTRARKYHTKKLSVSLRKVFGKRVLFLTLSVFAVCAVISFFFLKQQSSCANSISCISDLSGLYDPNAKEGVFNDKKVSVPGQAMLAEGGLQPSVLGATTGNKKIYVDLTNQRVYAFQGTTLIYNFIAATGKYYPTPAGTFTIWTKLQATRMAGGNPQLGTYYDLPNVPYTMYFYNEQYPKTRGYGLHGAYWLREDQFGKPQSHGCVNLHIEDAHKIYDWADPPTTGYTTNATDQNPGTQITIYGVTPNI